MPSLHELLRTAAAIAADRKPQQEQGSMSPAGMGSPRQPKIKQQLLPPMTPAAAALSPALKAAEDALEAKLADGGATLQLEYLHVPHGGDPSFPQINCQDAKANRPLNRYTDVLPYDHNRIRLQTPHNGHDYINASPLTSDQAVAAAAAALNGAQCPAAAAAAAARLPGAAPPGPPVAAAAAVVAGRENAEARAAAAAVCVDWSYIATQGPLRHTRDAFWQLVVEQSVSVVVMLTNTTDAHLQKCAQYFPSEPGTKKNFGRFSVKTSLLEQVHPELFRRRLSVVDTEGRQATPHRVLHYHYTAWPDHGVPRSSDLLLDLCDELALRGARAAPILVHCSAGIGRTGVFCVIDVVSRQLRQLATLDTPEAAATAARLTDLGPLVALLRRQRAGMVQTAEQYIFCHAALLEFVRRMAAARLAQAQEAKAQGSAKGAGARAGAEAAAGAGV